MPRNARQQAQVVPLSLPISQKRRRRRRPQLLSHRRRARWSVSLLRRRLSSLPSSNRLFQSNPSPWSVLLALPPARVLALVLAPVLALRQPPLRVRRSVPSNLSQRLLMRSSVPNSSGHLLLMMTRTSSRRQDVVRLRLIHPSAARLCRPAPGVRRLARLASRSQRQRPRRLMRMKRFPRKSPEQARELARRHDWPRLLKRSRIQVIPSLIFCSFFNFINVYCLVFRLSSLWNFCPFIFTRTFLFFLRILFFASMHCHLPSKHSEITHTLCCVL